MNDIKRIGIMTGGGDCPGLNAVIRAVVHAARNRGWEVLGIEDATNGLIDLDYKSPHGNRWLDERSVVLEVLTGIKRAGADVVVTYHALDVARWLNAP